MPTPFLEVLVLTDIAGTALLKSRELRSARHASGTPLQRLRTATAHPYAEEVPAAPGRRR